MLRQNLKKRKQIHWLFIALLLIILDQTIKWWLINNSNISNGFIYLTKNNKFIFGYGSEYDIFFMISIFIILLLFIIINKNEKNILWIIAVMLAGAASNLIDRAFRGGVIDYFKINLNHATYFNLADLYLLLGLFIYLFLLGRENEKTTRN